MRKLINVVITSSIMIVVVMILRKLFGSRKTYKSAAFVLVIIVVAVTVLAFGGGSVKGSSELPESGIEADIQNDNDKMQNYLVTEYKYRESRAIQLPTLQSLLQ